MTAAGATCHPADALLLAYAAGSLDEATALLVAAHATLCAACRRHIEGAEGLGGDLLEQLPPDSLAPDSLVSVLRRVAATPEPAAGDRATSAMPALPAPVNVYLGRGGGKVRWRSLAPGIRQALLVDSPRARVRLFRIKAGKAMPHHGHAAAEFTLVLQGGFSDEQGQYEVGDFTVADRDRAHQPVAAAHGCVCLILSSAPMQLTSRFGWLINPFMPF